jgi:hypothetical protein
MKTRYFFNLAIFVLAAFQIQAQDNYFIKVTKVYPSPKTVVYTNSYKLIGESETAIKNLNDHYKGENANYVIEIKKPSGTPEKREIQNIYFVYTTDTDDKKYTSSKPHIQESSPVCTVKKFKCDIEGKPIGSPEVENYCYHFKYFEGATIEGATEKYSNGKYYSDTTECINEAKKYFDERKNQNIIRIVRWYKGTTQKGALTNEKEYAYHKFLAKAKTSNDIDSIKLCCDSALKCDFTKKEAGQILNDKYTQEINKAKNTSLPLGQRRQHCQNALKLKPGDPAATNLEKEINKINEKNNNCSEIVKQYKEKKWNELNEMGKKNTKKEAFNAIISCIEIDTTYSKKNIEDNLKHCQEAVTKYMEQSDRTQINDITEKLKKIFEKMRGKDPYFDFSWDEFFKSSTNSTKISNGIEKLIQINNKIG